MNKLHRPTRSEKSSDSKSNWSLHKQRAETKFSVCGIDLAGKMKLTEELESGEGDDERGQAEGHGSPDGFSRASGKGGSRGELGLLQ
ncbi:hypothetical protein NL676_021200 [Syzygium grande]|nr:hypothetical protein NL676_021200 [Syzygium grande]